jgi:hypothetical protein
MIINLRAKAAILSCSRRCAISALSRRARPVEGGSSGYCGASFGPTSCEVLLEAPDWVHSFFTLIWLSVLSCWTALHCCSAIWGAGAVPAQAASNGKKANAIHDLDMKETLPIRTRAFSSSRVVWQGLFRRTGDAVG